MKKKESKSSKSLAKKKANKEISSDRFLLKKGSQLLIVNKYLIDTMPFQEIMLIAESTYTGLKHQLYMDALKGDHFVENMKVVDALQVGLNALYLRHPILRDYVRDCGSSKLLKEILA